MEDETGNVYVYGLTATKQEINDKSFSSLNLKVGDTVTVVGFRSDYEKDGSVTVELGGTTPAYYVSHIPGEGGDDPDQPGEASGIFTSSIEWELGSSAYDQAAVINGEEVEHVLKLGTSSKAGTATLTIPEDVTKIGFYAVAWKGLNEAEIEFGEEIVTVRDNEGAASNPPYTIEVEDVDYYEVEVDVDVLTIKAAKRVIIFGVNAVE